MPQPGTKPGLRLERGCGLGTSTRWTSSATSGLLRRDSRWLGVDACGLGVGAACGVAIVCQGAGVCLSRHHAPRPGSQGPVWPPQPRSFFWRCRRGLCLTHSHCLPLFPSCFLLGVGQDCVSPGDRCPSKMQGFHPDGYRDPRNFLWGSARSLAGGPTAAQPRGHPELPLGWAACCERPGGSVGLSLRQATWDQAAAGWGRAATRQESWPLRPALRLEVAMGGRGRGSSASAGSSARQEMEQDSPSGALSQSPSAPAGCTGGGSQAAPPPSACAQPLPARRPSSGVPGPLREHRLVVCGSQHPAWRCELHIMTQGSVSQVALKPHEHPAPALHPPCLWPVCWWVPESTPMSMVVMEQMTRGV